jgi:hypothetical protein
MGGSSVEADDKGEDDEGIASNVQIHVSGLGVRKPILNYNEMSRIDKGNHHRNWRQKWDETKGVDEGGEERPETGATAYRR